VAGQEPQQQPRRCARIAEIQDVFGFEEASDATAAHTPDPVAVARHLRAHQPHRRGGAEHVLAFQKAVDLAFAHGDAAQHQRPVRDRLVAGHANPFAG
jgi:hypothetical protein